MTYTFSIFLFLALIVLTLNSCNLSKVQANGQEFWLKSRKFRQVKYENSGTQYSAFAKLTGKPVLVFVHGFGANGVLQWTETASRLSQDYDIILPDLMFHGHSNTDAIADSTVYSLEFQVESLHKLLVSSGKTKDLTLIGNSYGGAVAAMYATKYPNEVKKLILNNAVTPYFTSAMAQQTAVDLGAENVMEMLAPSTAAGSNISMKIVYYKPPYIPPFLKKQVEMATRPNRENRAQVLNYLMSHEAHYKTFSYDFKCPVYLIWGERDLLIPSSTAEQAMNAWHIPPENLQIIPKTAHVPNLERSGLFHKALLRVL
jgi:pimeloyl-ACP methyl ester carboxylesterase